MDEQRCCTAAADTFDWPRRGHCAGTCLVALKKRAPVPRNWIDDPTLVPYLRAGISRHHARVRVITQGGRAPGPAGVHI